MKTTNATSRGRSLSLVVTASLLAACGRAPQPAPAPERADPYAKYVAGELRPNGAYKIEVLQDGVFRELGSSAQDEFFREQVFPLETALLRAKRDEIVVRLYKVRGHAAHLDAVTLAGAGPLQVSAPGLDAREAAAFVRKLAARDFDVTELPRAPLTLTFARPKAAAASLSVTARIEAERICETPFYFPPGNGATPPLQPDSEFFRYELGSVKGRLALDGSLDEVSDEPPFMRELAKAGTGHPSDDVLAWVRDDGERLYVAIDFTGDNTQDGGKDFAAVYVKTDDGVREYKVTAEDSRHGVAGFGYSKAVGYAHKLYELSIALADLGARPLSTLQLAFATYGTCSPCLCGPGQNFDARHRCCPPDQIDIDGFCCDELAEDGSCLPPRGAVFDIKQLQNSGTGEHVTDLNSTGTLGAAAVGYSGFGNTVSSATAWNVGLAGAVDKRIPLMTWDDYSDRVQSRAFGINDSGLVVGWRVHDDGERALARGFLVTPSSPPLPYESDSNPEHNFVHGVETYSPSTLEMELLPGHPEADSYALAINNATPPQIVGASGRSPALWQGGALTALPLLEPAGEGAALAINDAGVAVGYATRTLIEPCEDETCERAIRRPVIWDGGTITDLSAHCPTCEGRAADINNNGWVVGVTTVVGSPSFYAFVHIPSGAPAGMTNGMNVIGLGPTFAGGGTYFGFNGYYQTIGLNDHNQIVGTVLENGEPRAFLWLPEPAYQLEPGFYYLDDLIAPISGGANDGLSSHIMRWSVDISNAGTLVAYGLRRNPSAGDHEYYLALLLSGNRPFEHLPHIDNIFMPPDLDLDLTVEDGDPVNTFSGELILREEPDLAVGALAFERFYAGRIEERDPGAQTPLGPGWRHTYQWSLELNDGVEPQRVTILSPERSRTELAREGLDWAPLGADAMGYQLVEVIGGFELVTPVPHRLLRFDDDGRLVGIESPEGYAQTLSYIGDRLTSIRDSFDHGLALGYTGDQLTSVSDGTRTVHFAYDGDGEPLRFVTDVLDHVTEYTYDGAQRLVAKVLPKGTAHFTQTYDGDGRVVRQTDAAQHVNEFLYDYDGIPNRTALVDALGNVRVHQYTRWARLLTIHDELGFETQYHYDQEGQRIGTGLGLRLELEYSRDPVSGRPMASIDLQGGALEHLYEESPWGNVTRYDRVQTTYPDGTYDFASYVRGPSGTVVTLFDRAELQSSVTLDSVGQPISTTNALGGITAYTYEDGRLASVTSPAGDTTEVEHALNGSDRITTMSYPDGSRLVLTYDARRKLVSRSAIPAEASSPALTHSYAYDANGNLESSTDPLGHTASYVFDGMDRLTQVVDAAGHGHGIEYDERGLISRVVDGSGVETRFGYDAKSQLVSITDAHGLIWTIDYDAHGRVVSRAAPESEAIHYEYFDRERLLVITDPLGASTTFAYDAMGRVVSMETAEGGVACYTYDARGLLRSAKLPGEELSVPCDERTDLAVTAEYGWNAAGLLESVLDPNEQPWEQAYDTSGRLASTVDPLSRATSYAYDERDRLSSVAHPNGDLEQISYDAYGRIAQRLYQASGQADESFDFTYDALGRITSLQGETFAYDENGVLTSAHDLSFTSDAAGRLRTVTLAPGLVVTYVYDKGRLTAVQDWLGGELTFAYDDQGRLQRLTRPNGVSTTYGHDALDRTVSIREASSEALAETVLTYGADGRVSTVTRTQPAQPRPAASSPPPRTFDAASQIQGFDYDERGRPISGGGRSYAWSASGRLASYTEGAQTVHLRHDAYGSLIERTAGAETTSYRHSYAHTLPCPVERNAAGAVTYYVCTPAGALLYGIRADGGSRHYFHFDESGNTRLITDDDGAVVAHYAYLPFGEVMASGSASADNPFTFSGRYGVLREGQSGLFHMRKRIYDSRTQRFLTRDPLIRQQLEPRLVNPYQYAANDPILFVDPLGATPARTTYEGSAMDDFGSGALNINTNATYVLKEVPTALADSLAREAAIVRKYAPTGEVKLARLGELWGKVDRAERLAARADNLGTAGDVLGSAIEGYKMAQALNGVQAETLSCHDMAVRTLDNQLGAVRQSIKNGSIHPERGAELVREFSAQFDAALEQCNSRWKIDTALAALEGFKNTLAGITPAPVQHGLKAFESGVQTLGNNRNPFIFVTR